MTQKRLIARALVLWLNRSIRNRSPAIQPALSTCMQCSLSVNKACRMCCSPLASLSAVSLAHSTWPTVKASRFTFSRPQGTDSFTELASFLRRSVFANQTNDLANETNSFCTKVVELDITELAVLPLAKAVSHVMRLAKAAEVGRTWLHQY